MGIYAYFDPDILPSFVKNMTEKKNTTMSVEEYEKWRSSQKDLPHLNHDNIDNIMKNRVDDIKKDNDTIVKTPSEMKSSLMELLSGLQESENSFKQELQNMKKEEKRKANTKEEEAQLLFYKEETMRINKQLKFVKKM